MLHRDPPRPVRSSLNPAASNGPPRFEGLEPRQLLAADPVQAFFQDVTAQHGLASHPGGSGEFHAGGAVFTDLTNDGYADLYLPSGQVFTGGSANQLWVNVDDGGGGRTFQRVTNDGGTRGASGGSPWTTGAVAADYDNDGDLDLYVTEWTRDNILYKNMWAEDEAANGAATLSPADLRFVDVTASTDPIPGNPAGDIQHGLGYATFQNPDPLFGNDRLDASIAAGWADVNRDGHIDLYVGSWDGTNGDPSSARDGQLGERDTLYLNNGNGTFTDVTMGPDGVYITPTPTGASLLDDGGFESATGGTQSSGSDWVLTANAPAGQPSAQFQNAPWASTRGTTGVWFKGFEGSAANPANATLTQTVTAGDAGDYTLTFDANVESSFAATEFRVTLSSNGTGGGDSVDILNPAPNFNTFNPYTLSLTGVSAGDQLTVLVEMVDAAVPGPGPSQSVLMDNFELELAGTGGGTPEGWEQVGGWAYDDFGFNDTGLPAEFAGLNAMQFADFNNDGWQDIIVATMGGGGVGPNRDMLYVNRGNDAHGDWLGYHLISWEIGFGGNDSSEMGVTVADVDNDGDLDYFATDGSTTHSLWINQFADTGELTFVETFVPAVFSWGTNFHDFDNNGRVDLVIGTQANRPLILHLQDTDGGFHEVAQPAGLAGTNLARATLVADYDRDGSSDLLIFNIGGNNGTQIELYHNLSAVLNPDFHALNITLEGDPTLPGEFRSTRDAVGSRAYVTADFDGDGTVEADETRLEEVVSGHSQAASSSSLALEFGIGKATTADVRIVWASGREHVINDVAADQFLVFNEGDLEAALLPGDYNSDGTVSQGDLDLVLLNWGVDTATAGVPAGWINHAPAGQIGQAQLDGVLLNWGDTAATAASAAASQPAVTAASSADENPAPISAAASTPAADAVSTSADQSVRDTTNFGADAMSNRAKERWADRLSRHTERRASLWDRLNDESEEASEPSNGPFGLPQGV